MIPARIQTRLGLPEEQGGATLCQKRRFLRTRARPPCISPTAPGGRSFASAPTSSSVLEVGEVAEHGHTGNRHREDHRPSPAPERRRDTPVAGHRELRQPPRGAELGLRLRRRSESPSPAPRRAVRGSRGVNRLVAGACPARRRFSVYFLVCET